MDLSGYKVRFVTGEGGWSIDISPPNSGTLWIMPGKRYRDKYAAALGALSWMEAHARENAIPEDEISGDELQQRIAGAGVERRWDLEL